jgi:hypothetical protein
MSRIVPIFVAALATLSFGVGATPAQALSTTTFVSGNGFDSNPCTHTAPCRSFQAAVALTSPGGQVTMLDPAGYGAVTINHAISIVNDGGGEAGINAPGANQDAITISAGAGDVVNLRGLTLNGVGTGRFGIDFTSGGALNIQNCVIRNFLGGGVNFGVSAASAVTISDTTVSNNTGFGVLIAVVNSSTVTAQLKRVAALDNGSFGLLFASSGTQANPSKIFGTIVDSVAIGNGSNGFEFTSAPGPNGVTTLVNSKAIGNAVGLLAAGVTIYIAQTTLAGNTANGFNSTSLNTFGDNYIIDTNNSGSLTPIASQ